MKKFFMTLSVLKVTGSFRFGRIHFGIVKIIVMIVVVLVIE